MSVDDLWYLKKKGPDGKPVPSARHGRGKRWRVRYEDAQGNLKQPLFDKKTDAEAHDLKVRSDVVRGEYIDPNAGKVTLATYATEWREVQTFDESTRVQVEARLRAQILPALGAHELRVLATRPSIIQAWLRGMQGTLAPNYVRVIFSNLSQILSAAVDDGLITRNPCRAASVKPPPRGKTKVKPWPVEQVLAVRAGLPPEYQETVDLGFGEGLRQGEALGLSPDDIDWLRRVIHVRRQVKIVRGKLLFALPKGRKERDVPLADSVALRLSARLKVIPATAVTLPWSNIDGKPGKPVTVNLFFAQQGTAVKREIHNWAWKTALIAAGVIANRDEGSHDKMFHQLRHAYASTALADGVDIRALAAYLGHEDPGFTLRTYTHLMPTSEDRARQAIDAAYGATPERSSGTDPAQPRIARGRQQSSRLVRARTTLSSAN